MTALIKLAVMTLDDEYPEAKAGFRDPLGFAKTRVAKACQQCGTLTAWEHIALAVPLCSHLCFNRYVAANSEHEWVEP